MSHPEVNEGGERPQTGHVSEKEYNKQRGNAVSPVIGKSYTVRLKTVGGNKLHYADDLSGLVTDIIPGNDDRRTLVVSVSELNGSHPYDMTLGQFSTALTFPGETSEIGYLLPLGGERNNEKSQGAGTRVEIGGRALVGAGV